MGRANAGHLASFRYLLAAITPMAAHQSGFMDSLGGSFLKNIHEGLVLIDFQHSHKKWRNDNRGFTT